MINRRTRCVVLALALASACTSVAGGLERGFEALRIHDYFLARKLFLAQVGKNPAAAWYGLSLITGRTDNPFHQPDSAYTYLLRADAAFTMVVDERERKRFQALGVDRTSLDAQREQLHAAAWERTVEGNTIEGFERYLQQYHSAKQAADARLVRDHMAYQAACDTNTAAAFRRFLDRYPSARQVYDARTRLDAALYREATADSTIASFTRFITANPESPHVKDAEDAIYRLSTPHRSEEEFEAFIKDHPANHRVPDAWRQIYAGYLRWTEADAFVRFLARYPGFPPDLSQEFQDAFRQSTMVLLPFRANGQWGFITELGEVAIAPAFEWVEPFRNGLAQVGRDGRVGMINKRGREVVPIAYDDVSDHSEGVAVVERGGLVGLVDRTGEEVCGLRYSDVGDLHEGFAFAALAGSYGFIDAQGRVALPFNYDGAGDFQQGLAVVDSGGRNGAIDHKGRVVVPFEHDWIEGFEHGVARVRRDGRMGLIGPFGDTVLAPVHGYVGPFANGPALVVDGALCGYIDRSGHWAVPQRFEAPEGVVTWGEFTNGVAEVQLNGKRGAIDTVGRILLPAVYADIGPHGHGLIPVRKRTKWAYVDRANRPVTKEAYDQAWPLVQGVGRVVAGEMWGLIDSTGREVIPPRFTELAEPRHGLLVGQEAGRHGAMDLRGSIRVPFLYDKVTPHAADLVLLELDGRLAYFRTTDRHFIWKEEGFREPASPQ